MTLDTVLTWGADAAVVLGVAVMTVAVIGIHRMPDVYSQLHAASKSVLFGVIALLVAAGAAREPEVIARSVLIAVFLVITTPVGAHAVAWSARRTGEPMHGPDESGDARRTDDRRPGA